MTPINCDIRLIQAGQADYADSGDGIRNFELILEIDTLFINSCGAHQTFFNKEKKDELPMPILQRLRGRLRDTGGRRLGKQGRS